MNIIIDAYNVMRSTRFSDDCVAKVLKNQREQFLTLLSAYAEKSNNRIVAVFDGGGSGEVFGNSEVYGLVEVRYSAGGETADEVIKKLAAEAQNPREVLIITSDKEISYYARNCGATVVSAVDFYSKIRRNTAHAEKEPTPGEYFEKHVKGFDEEADKKENYKKNKGKKRRKNNW